MNTVSKFSFNERERALLQCVSIPDLALKTMASVKLMQSNSPELLNRPEADDNAFVAGAIAGGWVLPTGDGKIFMPVPPGFTFSVIGFTQAWVTGEIDADGKFQPTGEPYAKEPPTARWRKNPDRPGKKIYKSDDGLWVRELIGVIMLPEATGVICRYIGQKTAVKPTRAFSTRAEGLTVDGLDNVRGCVLGRFRATSFPKSEDGRHWHTPVFSLVGKLGAENGPTEERVLEIAAMRDAFLKGGAAISEPKALDAPADAHMPPIEDDAMPDYDPADPRDDYDFV